MAKKIMSLGFPVSVCISKEVLSDIYTVVAFIVIVKLVWKKVKIQLGNVMLIKVASHQAIPGMSCKIAMTPPFSAICGSAYTVTTGGEADMTTSVAATVDATRDVTVEMLLGADIVPIRSRTSQADEPPLLKTLIHKDGQRPLVNKAQRTTLSSIHKRANEVDRS